MTHDQRAPVTTLSTSECWAHLASHKVGRLVTSVASEPEVFPVNFIVDDGGILLRTAEGSKLFAVALGSPVAFEVDRWDNDGATSVIARGTARELTESADVERAESLPLRPWVPTLKTHWVRIDVRDIAGRSFSFGPEPEPEYPGL